jgi:hypothetical protein
MKTTIIAFAALCFIACRNKQEETPEKFDKTKWAIQKDRDYPHRDNMLNDLIDNYKLHGLKMDSIINLLGQPSRIDSLYLFYTIKQKRLGNIFPLSTKTLVIKFKEDSTLEWRKIHQ